MTGSDFDEDRFLAEMLNAASGPHPDTEAAYGAVIGRVRTVRRRRAAVVLGAGTACMVGAFAFAAVRGGQDATLRPATSLDGVPVSTVGTDTTTTDVSDPTSTMPTTSGPRATDPTRTDPTGSPSSTAPAVPGGGPSTSGQPGTTRPTTTQPTTAPPSTADPTTTAGQPTTTQPTTTQPTTTQPTTTQPTTTTAAPTTTSPPVTQTRTFSCAGGSATVRISAGRLTLVSSSTAGGFTVVSSEARPDRVRIRWESTTVTSRLEVSPNGSSMTSSCDDKTSGGGGSGSGSGSDDGSGDNGSGQGGHGGDD